MIPKAKNQKPFFERFQDGKMKKITPEKYQDKPQPEAPTKFDLEGFAKSEGIDFKALQEFVNTQKMPKETAQPKPMVEPVKMEQPETEEDFGAPIVGLEDEEEVGDIEENAYPQQLVDFFDMDESRTWKEYDNNSFKYEGNDYDFILMAKGNGYKLFVDDTSGETVFESEFGKNQTQDMQDIIDNYENGGTEEESQPEEVAENFTSEELEELFDDSDYNWQMMSVADNEAFYQTDYQSDTTDYIVDVIIKDGEVRFDAYDLETDEELAVESSTPISTSKVMNGRELDAYLERFLNKLK